MKLYHAFIAFMLPLLLFSCKKNDNAQSAALPDGNYAGTFKVFTLAGAQATAHVTLSLSAGHFSGNSDTQYYPGICSGSYTATGDSVRFINGCNWPQNVDQSVILNGTYTISQSGDSTVLASGFTDDLNLYTLKRQ